MDRKNVTPKMKKNKNNSLWRKLGLGLVGGIVGGLLTAGIFYAAMGTGNNSSTATSGNQNSAGETVVENVKVNVDSEKDTEHRCQLLACLQCDGYDLRQNGRLQ